MQSTLNPGEEAQLRQTIEMFEVITQSQPQDYQSLEILKEAYLKLNMEKEVVLTSKRIAQAYVQLGQLSSAILEYETILQRHPEDRDAMAAMAQIESKANNLTAPQPMEMEPPSKSKSGTTTFTKKSAGEVSADVDDGRNSMHKFFVGAKLITEGDFQACWPTPDFSPAPAKICEPFIQKLDERQILPLEKSIKVVADRCRLAYIPMDRYEIDMDIMRIVPRPLCQRWCIMPVDRMSKTLMLATSNPFNKQAVIDFEDAVKLRILWYLASPIELTRILTKALR